MFERYTERSRRVLFFARYEASQYGEATIEVHHVLLGLLREGEGITNEVLADFNVSPEGLREQLELRIKRGQKISTSIEIPFTEQTKQALMFAAEEANALHHSYIGTEHLLLGILREERSIAATVLIESGLTLARARQGIVNLLRESPHAARDSWPDSTIGFTVEPAESRKSVRHRIFASSTQSFSALCDEATAFASELGPRRLINISTGAEMIVVWYWE
jgi:ATP-dependent Clp protease ATP-binding subunit ClpA